MKNEDYKPSLNRIISELNKRFGENTIGRASKLSDLAISNIPSGSARLNESLGGGFPLGRMVELYGQPGAGKSLISLLTVRNAQSMGLACVYIDAEKSFDPVWTKSLGVDVDKLVIVKMHIAEDIIDTVAKILAANPGMIVIDSIAAMSTRSEMEEESDQQFMALKARLMSRGLSKLNALNKQTLIIWVNQLRNTLTMYGAPTTTPGGNALKYFASIRIEVKRDTQLITKDDKKTGEAIGQVVNWKVTKNKVAIPYRIGSFRFLFPNKIEE